MKKTYSQRRRERRAEAARIREELTADAEARAAALTEYPDHTTTGMVNVLGGRPVTSTESFVGLHWEEEES